MTKSHKEVWIQMMMEAGVAMGAATWHWFQYHFHILPPRPFARSIVDACTDCELLLPGARVSVAQGDGSIRDQKSQAPYDSY